MFAFCVDVDPVVEEEFNEWYNDHLAKVVACPGIVSGQRFTAREVAADGRELQRYWAIYEVEAKEAMTGPEVSELSAKGFGRFEDSVRNPRKFWFTPISPEVR